MSARWHAIVLSWNGREDTLSCLESLERVTREDLAVVCVDNASTDGSAQAVRERFPAVTLIEAPANLGYSAGNNLGLRHALAAGARWMLLLNNDATVDPGGIEGFERAARRASRRSERVSACSVKVARIEARRRAVAVLPSGLWRSSTVTVLRVP